MRLINHGYKYASRNLAIRPYVSEWNFLMHTIINKKDSFPYPNFTITQFWVESENRWGFAFASLLLAQLRALWYTTQRMIFVSFFAMICAQQRSIAGLHSIGEYHAIGIRRKNQTWESTAAQVTSTTTTTQKQLLSKIQSVIQKLTHKARKHVELSKKTKLK